MASNRRGKRKQLLRLGRALLGICMVALPTGALAANDCAWINEATASGLLGGDAVGEVSAPDPAQPIVCTFTQMSAGVKRILRVTVEIAPNPQARLQALEQSCGAERVPLKAIGNEAQDCGEDDRKAGMGESVVGRVRDQVFTISITSSLKKDPLFARDALKSKIYTAAEQVAGNLF
jgi:hypothetical protein